MDKVRKTERENDKKEIGRVSNRERDREMMMMNQKDHLLLMQDSRQTFR